MSPILRDASISDEALRVKNKRMLSFQYHDAAPASMIGVSNFFELAVAKAIVLLGPMTGVALAAVVGVLVDVPVMLHPV
jgi:arsenite transporter